jgi:threonine aldolase
MISTDRIDLRSDTVTKPTAAMREAMTRAEVGDDVYGEDPTVQRLEARAMALTGKPAALYVVSGIMGNQLAMRCATSPGDEIIVHEGTHPVHHEAGAPALLSGVSLRAVPGARGAPTVETVTRAIRSPARWHSPTRMLMVENTHNYEGGAVLPLPRLEALRRVALDHGLHVHMDGARVWNAVTASGVPLADYAAQVDSLSFCLSKGLGAPIGSLLVGEEAFIARARRFRTAFGGAWRQAGILAAAGLHALAHHVPRLADDHAHARLIAQAVEANPRLRVVSRVETNIVIFELADEGAWDQTQAWLTRWREQGIWMGLIDDHHRMRAVTHLDVSAEQAKRAAQAIAEAKA